VRSRLDNLILEISSAMGAPANDAQARASAGGAILGMTVHMMREEGVGDDAIKIVCRFDVNRAVNDAKKSLLQSGDKLVATSKSIAVGSLEAISMALQEQGATREAAVVKSCDIHIEQALWMMLAASPGGWEEVSRKVQEIMDEMETAP